MISVFEREMVSWLKKVYRRFWSWHISRLYSSFWENLIDFPSVIIVVVKNLAVLASLHNEEQREYLAPRGCDSS